MREMSVAGSFYPGNAHEIERYIAKFTAIYDRHFRLPNLHPKAVIVPHAGYVFSGFSAHVAYRELTHTPLKRFVILGPSHKIAYKGVSMCEQESYNTPLGVLHSDKALLAFFQKRFGLKQLITHREHSTEVQFPLLKHYIPDASIVELVYGSIDTDTLSQIMVDAIQLGDVGVIVSTDLSHFYPLEKANKLDSICIEGIQNLDVAQLHSGCEACGFLGVEGIVKAAKRLHLHPTILDYRTSADASADTHSVVGYLSVAFE